MMNIKKFSRLLPAIALVAIFAWLSLAGCKKNGPTVAIITVVDSFNRAVPAAVVTLWQDTSHSTQTGYQSTIRVTKNSDTNGKVSFEFKQEAWLNIEAIKGLDTAIGNIQLKEHETVTATVKF